MLRAGQCAWAGPSHSLSWDALDLVWRSCWSWIWICSQHTRGAWAALALTLLLGWSWRSGCASERSAVNVKKDHSTATPTHSKQQPGKLAQRCAQADLGALAEELLLIKASLQKAAPRSLCALIRTRALAPATNAEAEARSSKQPTDASCSCSCGVAAVSVH